MVNYINNPQFLQNNLKTGSFIGTIVDNCDPEGRHRVRVWVYELYGDYNGRLLAALPWAEVFHNGGVRKFEIWDRAKVTFIGGNPDCPSVDGTWKANPSGAGTLPHSAAFGTEIDPEARSYSNLAPDVDIVGKSGEGSAIWIEQKLLNQNQMFSSIQSEDTGGKYFRIRSFHKNTPGYSVNSKANISQDLYKVTLPERTPIRDGLSPEVADPSPGVIELGHQNLKRVLWTDDKTFTLDSVAQKNDSGDYDLEVKSTNGMTHKIRQGQGVFSMSQDSIFMTGSVFAPAFMSVPERWDK